MDESNALKANHIGRQPVITARRVDIRWNEDMPVFAKEEFLRAVGDEYGWLGGFDERSELRCILPYTILRKAGFRLVRFRNQTIPCCRELDIAEERSFLNSAVTYFKGTGADMIIPSSNNAVFRTYPDGAYAAPYGTYVIDLQKEEETLWRGLNRTVRLNIGTAQRGGVLVRDGSELLDEAYDLICATFRRSKISFMSRSRFKTFATGLGEHGRLLVAVHAQVPQSFCLFGFSRHCAYAIYAGNVAEQHQGANKLLYWEAMRTFRSLGVRKFDFYGARIRPQPGSKQEGINLLKERFGAALVEGYLWKYTLRPLSGFVYSGMVRLIKGGDIVDLERHKLQVMAR